MASRLLRGIVIVCAMVFSGLWASLGHPMAMLNALLSPFSARRWRRLIEFKLSRYYERLTKKSLMAQLRSDLLSKNGNDPLSAALCEASRKKGPLYSLFQRFSVKSESNDVWTKQQFSVFVSTQLGNDSGCKDILWRCFCYNARYPFTDLPPNLDHEVLGLEDWLQAIALLATDAHLSVGRNLEQLYLYSCSKDGIWNRFVSLSVPDRSAASVNDSNLDAWQPPDELDNVSKVVATLLPIDMPCVGPPLSQIRQDVRTALLSEHPEAPQSISTNNFIIPYEDLLSLFCAILRVHKSDSPNELIWEHNGITIEKTREIELLRVVAKGILKVGGIHPNTHVSFNHFLSSSDKSSTMERDQSWLFDWEIRLLWRGFFSGFISTEKGLVNKQSPPPFIIQAVDYLFPLPQSIFDRYIRRQQTLLYTSATETFGPSLNDVVGALTWPYRPKMAVIYGNKADTGEPSVFVILMSSPLWCMYTTGAIDDFYVDDEHILFEITSHPRAMQFCSQSKTKFADIVKISKQSELSFETVQTGQAARKVTRTAVSGLTLHFESRTATISSATNAGTDHVGYAELPAGQYTIPPTPLQSATPWTSSILVTKIEVYDGELGVASGLCVERVN